MKAKIALITGGAGHIGQEVSRALASKGVKIIMLDKDKKAGKAAMAKLTARYGAGHAYMDADLMDPKVFKKMHTEIKKQFGQLNFLVNNAAFYDDAPGWGVDFNEEGYEAWLKVMRVNLLAPFFLTQSLAPLMPRGAAIVNIGSTYGVVAPDFSLYEGLDMTNPAAYAASKGGLLQLTKWLSTRLAPDIRVNMVSPGGVERGQKPEFIKRYKKKTPLGRMAVEKDVAGAVAFLLSDEAHYITGQNLLVDGGWTAW